MPKISVIVTAYKDRGWIDESIQTALNQTFKDYEVVFAVDGNQYLMEYALKYDIPFFHFPKSNYANMVNQAIGMVKGEWIKILHDDDLLVETSLQDLYDARGRADLVYGNAICFNDNDIASARQYKPPAELSIKTLLPIITNPVNFEAELFRRDMFIDSGGFDPNLGYTEDYDFLLNILSLGYEVKYVDKDVVWYRHHERQITGNEPAMRYREQEYLTKKYMSLIVNNITW